ncbi:MAG: hypothetical protein ABJP45_15905, partial [Cyclobacteriaceae bacterium]
MKKPLQLFVLATISILIITSFTNKTDGNTRQENKIERSNADVQDCNGYYPLSEGVSFELTYFDKKDKAGAITKHRILESKNITNGVEVTCEMSVSDEK